MQYLYVWSVLQIVLESLPVSSSGNVILWMHLLHKYLQPLSIPIESLDFDFLLHGPTLFVVGLYFYKEWVAYLPLLRREWRFLFTVGLYCAWADALTAAWYFLFKVIGTSWMPLYLGFFLTGCLLASLVFYKPRQNTSNRFLSLYDATVLGIVQGIALLPGLSRFALTFVAAQHLGYAPFHAFGYSFLIQFPLIGAAFLKGCYSLYSFEYRSEILRPSFGITILIATVLSYAALWMVGVLIQKRKMHLFAWYVFALSCLAGFMGK